MDTVKEGIRRNLVELIASSGKRNVDLAKAVGVGKAAVSNWISGNSSIDIERIPDICDFFGITVDEFFGRSKAMQSEPPLQEFPLTKDEYELLRMFNRMDAEGKSRLIEQAAFLLERHPLNQASRIA